MKTDTSERGLGQLICTVLTGHPCEPSIPNEVRKPPTPYDGVGWIGGLSDDDCEHCVDLYQLSAFLSETQSEVVEAFNLGYDPDAAPKLMRYVPEWAAPHRERGT